MTQRLLPVIIFALVMAAIPFIPGVPPFWIVLLDNIGLAALVAMGLVLLTGVGGLTSFGQAAFCGFGAYTTAVLTTAYGLSPWLTLPLSLLVSGIAAVLLGLVTVRLSGHYLPLGTIAWGIALFYLFSKLEFLGRNDGISGIPPLSIGAFKMLSPGTIYFAIWIAVLIWALLTMNLLDSRTGRAIRALRRGHIAAEAFGVQTPRAKLLVFIYAAVLAGLSGWLYAHFQRAANPTPFGAQAGIEYLFIAVVGGAGYVWGARARRRHRRDPEGNPAELSAVYFRRPEPAGDHRVRHFAGDAAATRPERRVAVADGTPAVQAGAQEARYVADAAAAGAPASAPRAAAYRKGAKAIRRRHRRQRRLVRRPGARNRGADRPERRRQEHDLQFDHGRAGHDRRHDFVSRPKRRQRAATGGGQTRRQPGPSSMSSWCPT